MRIVLLGVLGAALTVGCAPLRPVSEATDYELCKAVILGNRGGQEVVVNEQRRRGLDCNPYLASIQMGEQARQQQIANGLMMLQLSRPQPMPMQPLIQPEVNCTSRAAGGTVYTNCR